jgi:hypothetical protein
MVSQSDNIATAQVLLNAYGIVDPRSIREQNVMLSTIVVLLLDELESLVAELKRHEYSDEAISPITEPFDRLSPAVLANAFQSNKPVFAASLPVLRSVGETPNLLTDDGTAISKDDLAQLSKDIETLRLEVQTFDLPTL